MQRSSKIKRFPPRPGIRDITGLLRRHHTHFLNKNKVLVVSAIWRGRIALPEQKGIIEDALREAGLSHMNVEYIVKEEGKLRSDSHRTIIIDGRRSRLSIYVKDQLVMPRQDRRY